MSAGVGQELLDKDALARLAHMPVLARFPMLGGVSGLHRSATRGSSVEFAEYRKYVPGDDIKHLDWRVYAKTDRFFMKEFEADTNLRCTMVLDGSASMAYAGKLDFARRLVATLSQLLIRQGDAVGLACFADRLVHDIAPNRSPVHLRHILETLAGLEPRGRTDLVGVLHALAEKVKRRSLVLVFSDLFSEVEAMLDCFQHMRFRKHDLAVFHVLDRQELDFAFDRPIRFVDCESEAGVLTDPVEIRAVYQEAIQAYLKRLRHGCREFSVDYRPIFTDMTCEEVLASFMLQRIQGGRTLGR